MQSGAPMRAPALLATLTLLWAAPALASAPRREEPAQAVSALLEHERPAIQRCYERALKRRASEGELVLSLSVARSGRLRSAEVVHATRGHASVGRCVARHLQQARLPKLTEAATVEVPIHLRPQG